MKIQKTEKNSKQTHKLQNFRNYSLNQANLAGLRGGDCCGSDDGEGHPPDPPKTMAATIARWGD